MYKILEKQMLNRTVAQITIDAPLIANKAEAGQFIILRAKENSERMPLTIAAYDRVAGTIMLIFQIVGAGTAELNTLCEGDAILDCVGPLGRPTHTEGLKKVCVVGGGVGCAIALPVAQKLHDQGAVVHSVIGFRTRDLVILEDAFRSVSEQLRLMTDDGSYGSKGLVTTALETLINEGNEYDEVIAIGPLVMMKLVSLLTKKYGVKTVVSMNTIMVDGTGMCGGCRLTVGGEIKFACVDGPDFDGHLVDFDEAISRSRMYDTFECRARDEACRLFPAEGR
ncbi:MAG: sulfide/dihydroorotate dehydrogenase-like FAD/NAD-binding protein [Clostridiales bacterium]|nr:sulfide/dihydroorotate dehydrogenase-like FAD/NAD-binding protein [Clostridiales bacterium]